MGIDEQATSQPPGAMRGAIVGTVALVTVFAAASAPIPLYATWQQQLGLSASDVSMTIVMYLFGVLSVLFFAGSLSDASGRRPTVGAALACGVAGCLLFIGLSSGPMLQFARFVQGVSCALSMSATSAFVIDCTSERHRTFGMTIASTGYLIGLTVGSLGIGFFATVSTAYWQVFAVMAVIMLATMLALPFAPETVHKRITWKKAVKPMTHVPAHLRKLLPIVAGGYISTWSVGFFFQSLSTPASVDYFGATDPLIPSLVLALAMAPSALGGPVSARMGTRSSMIVGYIIMFGAIVALGVCMVLGLLVPYLVLEVVFAVATGMIPSSSLHMLISASTPQENASVVTLANLTGYMGSTVVSTIQTGLTATFDLTTVYAFIALLAAISIVPGCISMAKHQR
ncbi:MFS transporter [Senegalimassilia anaerobia]|uniref:MFS transporter n=1 Tax=Senegalimassilia anaerobia TaxID=1473216 RepID=UPI0026EBC4E1|nr:MFS transporter [Senegalimassilia anaerobia]